MVIDEMSRRDEIIPKKQRALVNQGGEALGAYEAGVFREIYNRLYKSHEPFFDLVAGTSTEAINAGKLRKRAQDMGRFCGET